MRIGGSRIAHEGDDVAIIACGITLDEAVKAAERLAEDGVHARVLDAYSIKPIDAEAVRAAARECGAIVTVEDHAPEGGLGDAVLEALAEGDERAHVVKLAVREMPDLRHAGGAAARRAKIDADAIADAAPEARRRSGVATSSSWASRSSRRRTRRPGPSGRRHR